MEESGRMVKRGERGEMEGSRRVPSTPAKCREKWDPVLF